MIEQIITNPIQRGIIEVAKPYSYKEFIVPKGFQSDGATIHFVYYVVVVLALLELLFYESSFVLWVLAIAIWLLGTPFHPKHLTASVVHDYICRDIKDYKRADTYFLEIMLLTDSSKLGVVRAYTKYYAVSLYTLVGRPAEHYILKKVNK